MKAPDPGHDLLTLDEVRALLRKPSVRSVRDMIDRGQLPEVVRVPGVGIRVRAAALRARLGL